MEKPTGKQQLGRLRKCINNIKKWVPRMGSKWYWLSVKPSGSITTQIFG
jgi:hypothetical protein